MCPPPKQPSVERPAQARLLDRILRRARGDAFDEVSHLIAGAGRIRAVSEAEVAAIFERYGVDLGSGPVSRREKLYRDYLLQCLSDRRLTAEELADLQHLQYVLHLDQANVDLVHRRVAREVYSRSVDEVLADATVDDAERIFLTHLRDHLEIPSTVAENILEMKVRQRQSRDVGARSRKQG